MTYVIKKGKKFLDKTGRSFTSKPSRILVFKENEKFIAEDIAKKKKGQVVSANPGRTSTRTSTGGSSSSPGGASTGGVGSGIGGAGTGGAATGGASTGGYGTVTINLPAGLLKRAPKGKSNGQAANFTFNVGGAATSGRVASGSGPGARGFGGKGDGSGGGGGGGNTPKNSGRNDKWMHNPQSSRRRKLASYLVKRRRHN